MLKSILTAFLIGSSWPIFIIFFRAVYRYKLKRAFNPDNCIPRLFQMEPYDWYTQHAPLYLGLMSALAIIIHHFFNLSIIVSYSLIGIISSILVSTAITLCRFYNFAPNRLQWQYFYLLMYHFITFNVIALLYSLIR